MYTGKVMPSIENAETRKLAKSEQKVNYSQQFEEMVVKRHTKSKQYEKQHNGSD